MNSPITKKEFLTKEECDYLFQQVMQHEDKFTLFEPNFFFLGRPYYADWGSIKRTRDLSKTRDFNQFMQTAFPSLLMKLKETLSNIYQADFFYHNDMSYPGFHIVKLDKNHETNLNFHYDLEYQELSKEFPELQIDTSSPSTAFTVLLSEDVKLKSGLLIVENETFRQNSFMPPVQSISKAKFRAISSFFPYKQGEMNFQSGYPHSLYGKNEGDLLTHRITFQGHFVKTNKGHVIYW